MEWNGMEWNGMEQKRMEYNVDNDMQLKSWNLKMRYNKTLDEMIWIGKYWYCKYINELNYIELKCAEMTDNTIQ
jgi:hypothetical protein